MRFMKSQSCGFVAFSLIAVVSCGGSPAAPGKSEIETGSASRIGQRSGIDGEPRSCRTYPTVYRVVTVAGPVTGTNEGTCTFNNATVEGTCVNNYTDTIGQSFTSTSVTRHATIGDVVDEVQVIPPLNLALGTTTTAVGTTNFTSTATNTHDGQKRITGTTVTDATGRTTTTTYSAWDAAGRPTAGQSVIVGGSTSNFTHAYDDAARTQTSIASGVTCITSYDENGINLSGTCAGGSSTVTFTTISTAEVCRF